MRLKDRLFAVAAPFLFGVLSGLVLALWWRAAQIHALERDLIPGAVAGVHQKQEGNENDGY